VPDDPLSVVLIQIDSLSRHFLTTYGNDWVRTPNLTDLAARSAVFEQHYAGSLPCMPARREIWTGTEEHWWRPWAPLEPWDQPVAYLAGRAGITTGLVTDHYHFFEWGAHSYAYDFDSYEFIRGHEHDNWRSDPVRAAPDWAAAMMRDWPETELYVRNVLDFRREEDFFAPQVMTAAATWLERNRERERFYLHVDSFDVHEPFHVPEPYRSMYTDLDYRAFSPWARYGRSDDPEMGFTPNYLEWLRAQFAGKLTMVDTWLGRVLDTLDKHKLLERTAVIVTTDHGHYLGEHDRVGKPGSPLWHTLTHLPLIAWLPDGPRNGQRVQATTQTVDLYATVLDLLGVLPPEREYVHSRSFEPVLRGRRDAHRDRAVFGYASERAGITAGGWTLLRDQDPHLAPAHWYTHEVAHVNTRSVPARHNRAFEYPDLEAGRFIPGLATPVWRMPAGSYGVRNLQPPRPDLLYDNAPDSDQQRNLASERPDKVAELESLLREHARALQAPEEQLRRLRLD
jgi:arylsulfatase A-like enzyme